MVSLCISGGNQWLYRVADVAADNALLPLRIEKSSQMFEKLLCTPDMSMPKNTLDFWEWDADGFRRYAMPSQIRLRWIEVVKRSVNSAGGDRSRDFKARIQEGLKGAFPDDHDYLLEVESQAGKITCVYLKAENLEKRDNLTFLRTGIYSLDVYEIPDSGVAEIKKSYLPDFSKSCYLRLDLPRKARTIFVRDPSETARLAILKRLDECAQGLSQNGKNLVREFLSDRQNSTIIDAIAQECGCSLEEAEFLFNELASNSQKYFAPDDFASDLMLRIIGYNSEAAEKFKAAIAEKWETENREKIREAEEARSRLENDLGSLGELKNAGLQEQERLSIQLAELKAQISGLEDRRVFLTQQNQQALQTQQALQNQQSQWVQPQLQPQFVDQTAMLENMGEIIAKYAQLATREAAPTREETQTDTPSGFEEGHAISETDFYLESTTLVTSLSENLDVACVDRERSRGLAACLLSANFQNIPLIIAGFNAAMIVDALSATLFNKTADRYYCGPGCIDIPKGETPIAVFDGFGCMNRIIEKAKGRHVCFIAQTSEELGIEPRGLYNYALPLFTEHFIKEVEEFDSFEGYVFSGEKRLKVKARETFSLPIGTLLPLAKTRLDNMLGGMHFLQNDLTAMQLLLVSCVPILVSLARKQELIDIIAPLNLSAAERTELTLIIGAAS